MLLPNYTNALYVYANIFKTCNSVNIEVQPILLNAVQYPINHSKSPLLPPNHFKSKQALQHVIYIDSTPVLILIATIEENLLTVPYILSFLMIALILYILFQIE